MSTFAQLPDHIKEQVLEFLRNNNFPEAKKIYDRWLIDSGVQNAKSTHRVHDQQ